MGGFSFGHVGAWDVPINDLDEYAPADINMRDLPFADSNPAPPEPVKEFCPSCHWGLEADGSCWRCAGCPKCHVRLDADLNCCMCGETFFPHVQRDDREAA